MADHPIPPGTQTLDPVAAYQLGYDNATTEQRRKARLEVLNILEVMYMDDTNERDSPEARAILAVARQVAEEYRARGV